MTPPQQFPRRMFLRTSLGAAAALAIGPALESLAAEDEKESKEFAEPTTIIDTHTHFYDPSRKEGVPWPPKENKLLYRTVLPEHYQALPKPHPVAGTVIVEASERVEDNQWILDLAADEPFIVGFVGRLTPGEDGFRRHLNRFAKNRLYRGIRIRDTIAKAAQSDKQVLRDLRLLADKDLSVDLLGRPDMLPDVVKLAELAPRLRIVIDHIANLRIDGKTPPESWLNDMRAAADHENVYCKVSALVEGAAGPGEKATDDVDYYRPVLDALWDRFGADRLIYGSNWPVCARAADYATVQRIVERYFGEKGRGAVDKYFFQNARSAYKWIDRTG
ncbi:MAG: amidohydrolase family protein [Pirellulaceae bacterium]